jgi:hypothetical protein
MERMRLTQVHFGRKSGHLLMSLKRILIKEDLWLLRKKMLHR